MIVLLFLGSSVILATIIFTIFILISILGADRAINEMLSDYSFVMILILSALAIMFWAIIAYGIAEENGYNKKYITISSLLFGVSSGVSLYNCICLICNTILILVNGLVKEERLIILTVTAWLVRALFCLLLCVPVAGVGIGIPLGVSEFGKKEYNAYIWGLVALLSQIIILAVLQFVLNDVSLEMLKY